MPSNQENFEWRRDRGGSCSRGLFVRGSWGGLSGSGQQELSRCSRSRLSTNSTNRGSSRQH
eukprot:1134109-Pelagomonas_calceolata.AAC.1